MTGSAPVAAHKAKDSRLWVGVDRFCLDRRKEENEDQCAQRESSAPMHVKTQGTLLLL